MAGIPGCIGSNGWRHTSPHGQQGEDGRVRGGLQIHCSNVQYTSKNSIRGWGRNTRYAVPCHGGGKIAFEIPIHPQQPVALLLRCQGPSTAACPPASGRALRGGSTRPLPVPARHTARPVKDHASNYGAQRPARGVGTRCPHAARQPAPRPAGAYATCPPTRAGPATAVRSHRGLEGLTLTQEPCGITLQMLVRREERSQRDRCRPSDPAHRRRPTPM